MIPKKLAYLNLSLMRYITLIDGCSFIVTQRLYKVEDNFELENRKQEGTMW
jgi:5,10-methylenetetrahydrofolate reductase